MGAWGLARQGRTNKEIVTDFLTGAEFNTPAEQQHTIKHGPTSHDGAWWAIVNGRNGTYLACVTVTRHRDEVFVKGIDSEMGPNQDAPPAMFRRFEELVPQPRNEFCREWRERQRERKPAVKVCPGDGVVLEHPVTFSDDVTESRFVFVGGLRFRRVSDNHLVTLGRTWRRNRAYTVQPVAAEG